MRDRLRSRKQPDDTNAGLQRRQRTVDATLVYSPKGLTLTTGLLGAFLSPNKWVNAGFVVVGFVADVVVTRIKERRAEAAKEQAEANAKERA